MDKNISVVILNYNDYENTEHIVQELKPYTSISSIVVVDNASTDDSFEKLTLFEDGKVRVIRESVNGGYGKGNNSGVKYAYSELEAEQVIISNPDVSFSEECVAQLSEAMSSSSDIAIVSAVQHDIEQHRIKEYAWRIPTIGECIFSAGYLLHRIFWPSYNSSLLDKSEQYIPVECVPGAMLMVDAAKFLEVGGYDEDNFLYCEEMILGIKTKGAGYRTLLVPGSSYLHKESKTVSKSIRRKTAQKKMMMQSRQYFLKNWLHANPFQLQLGKIVFQISIWESWVKNLGH